MKTEDEEFDDPMVKQLAQVLSSVLLVALWRLTKVSLSAYRQDDDNVDINVVRGVEDIKEAEVEVAGVKIKAAVATWKCQKDYG